MKLREKSKPDAKGDVMSWDAAQAALQSGAYEIVDDEGKVVAAEGDGLQGRPEQPPTDVTKAPKPRAPDHPAVLVVPVGGAQPSRP